MCPRTGERGTTQLRSPRPADHHGGEVVDRTSSPAARAVTAPALLRESAHLARWMRVTVMRDGTRDKPVAWDVDACQPLEVLGGRDALVRITGRVTHFAFRRARRPARCIGEIADKLLDV